ncbi:MAG TPA: high-potential iron-sulfur protein [Sulfuriferula sp.]|nr:high-potential iron-sulfur protein [Sulfuriferula sp.]
MDTKLDTKLDTLNSKKVSRRSFLKGAALLASIAVVPVVVASKEASAAAKASQAAMQYQDHPKGKLECSNCIQFIPGKNAKAKGTCKVVEGAISPQGYCIAYAPKA